MRPGRPSAGMRDWFRLKPSLILTPLAAVLVPLGILAVGAWLGWTAAWDDAAQQLRRTADAGSEYSARVLEGQAVALHRINDRLNGVPDAEIRANERYWHHALTVMVAELPQTDGAYLLDRRGRLLVSTRVFPVPQQEMLDGRDYFTAFNADDPPDIYVSRPFTGRFSRQPLFSVARARTASGNPPAADSGVEGIVVVSLSPSVVADGMRRMVGAGDDVLALVREDGTVITSTRGQGVLPSIPTERPFHALVASGVGTAAYRTDNELGEGGTLQALRRIEGFPVYAVSLRPRQAIVAHWGEHLAQQMVFGLPAAGLLLLLTLRGNRDQLRLDSVNAGLEDDVERSADRLKRAERFGLVATFEIDLRSGVNYRSAEYMAVQGRARSAAEERHEDWLRRLHPDDRERAERIFLEASADDSGITDYAQSYRIVRPDGEVRWIAARGEIERDGDGRALFMRGAHVDVTPLRSTERALAESDARLRLAQEAAGIGTWEWDSSIRAINWSRTMIEIWGFDPEAGQPDRAATVARLHPADRGRVRREIATAQRTGVFRSEFRILRPSEEGSEVVWLTARARRLSFAGGQERRLMGVAYDVTERKLAEERATLLAHEVEHRAKNALAIVSGLLRVTTADSAETFASIMEGRVLALARTMTLLGRHHWEGALLSELIAHELEPFGTERLALSGPRLMIEPAVAQPLSMALHELTTNAAKYGALSVPGGRLEVGWQVEGRMVRLTWGEVGGPGLVGAPSGQSFGMQLIRQTFESRLGGRLRLDWTAAGLICKAEFEVGDLPEGGPPPQFKVP